VGPLLPGHGTSVEQLSQTGHQQWLQSVLDTHDQLARTHSRIYVLGLSLGGLLALHLCTVRPIHAALVLAAPLDLGFFRRNLVRLAVPFLPAIPRTPGVWDPQARLRDVGYRQMPLRAVMELMDLQRSLVGSLASVTAPVRLLYSRRDGTVHVRDAARIADSVGSSDVRVQYLEHSGHILTMDLERERVASWITDQLAELEALALRG
jgi:carboxylesterase